MTEPREPDVDVVIAGAGPTGLMLAGELALAGVRTVVLERARERPSFCRAFNLNARSLELLDRRGLVERFLAECPTRAITFFAGLDAPLSLGGLDSDHPYTLGIPQTRTEELLEERAQELGVPIQRGHEVVGLDQDADGVRVSVRGTEGEYTLQTAYLVGCDGGRSTVRKLAGIAFPGTPTTRYALLGDVTLHDPESLAFGSHRTTKGAVYVIPRPGYVRIITGEITPPAEPDAPVSLDQLQAAVRHVLGREVAMAEPRWLTRFGNAARQAERYRAGRVLLAGDAAHIHLPAGAQGLNVGLQDAFNLGWKLAAHVHGWAPAGLLDTYERERHEDGARVLMNTRAQEVLADPEERFDPLRALFAELAQLEVVHQYLAEMVTGVGTRYDLGVAEPHPLLGRLAPNLSLETRDGTIRVAQLLHAGRGVLLDLTDRAELSEATHGWRDRVDTISARCRERPDLAALLLRPDGYTAWVTPFGREEQFGSVKDVLTTWFGTDRRSVSTARHSR